MKITAPLKILLLLSLFFFMALPLRAQTAMGLSAIPPRLEVTLKAGEVISKEIKIRNESKVDKLITTSIQDFIVIDNHGTPLQIENTDQSVNRWAASSWIQVSPTKLLLKPGETKALVLTIIAPENAIPGGHYAMIIHTPDGNLTMNQTGTAVEAKVGTLVYVTIPGTVNENASIKKFSAPRLSEYGPIDFKTTVTNLSDIHITPAGTIKVTNLFGLPVAKINLSNTNIFPYTSREFINTLDKKFLFGRYQAQINAVYGTTGQLLTATLFFWVIPYKIVIVTLLILVILYLLFRLFKNKKTPDSDDHSRTEELERELEALKKKYQDSH